MLSEIFKRLREAYQVTDAVFRGRACDTMEHELEELEHIFALLVLGSFVGLPSPRRTTRCESCFRCFPSIETGVVG